MKGLILAAGSGERLKPFSTSIPKALINIKNKPMISYVISRFEKAGIKILGIVIRKRDECKFKKVLGNCKLNISYIYQNKPIGSAHALLQAKEFIGENQFLLSWCDFLSPFDFRKIVGEHLKYNPDATILIKKETSASPQNLTRSSLLNPRGSTYKQLSKKQKLNNKRYTFLSGQERCISSSAQVIFKNQYIIKIAEKPKNKISDWVMTGVMALNSDIFSILNRVVPPSEDEFYLTDVLDYWIHQGGKVRFLKIDTWRINVNTPEDIKNVEKLILKHKNL